MTVSSAILQRRHGGGSMMDMGGMDHSMDHGMGMGGDMTCSMDMLGNWKVTNICVLTSSWHVKTTAQFVGTCIGVFLLVVLIEAIRRWGREWDRYIVRNAIQQRLALRLARRQALLVQQQQRQGVAAGKDDARSASDSVSTQSQNQSQAQLPRTQAQIQPPLSRNRALARIESAFFGVPAAASGTAAAINRARFRPTAMQQFIRSLVYAVQFAGAYIVMLIAMTFNGYILIAIILGGFAGHFVSTWDNLSRAVSPDEDEDDLLLDSNGDDPLLFGSAGAGTAGGAAGTAAIEREKLMNTDEATELERAEQRALRVGNQAHSDMAYGSGACCG
ncbi:copper transporter complex subunit Ctr4 [Tilletia horrida]|uniref:Copper transport protein n=1 Tax=Tilletia horrida TaxID=155126 RepID=A0AAN6GEV6_9BASI|nr:copper transporter complex subunit Ctr4 [Tilletia horrida]